MDSPTKPPFDWETVRTAFLAEASGLEFFEVLLVQHYVRPTGPDADDSIYENLPADWHPRLMAAWDEWELFLEERIHLAKLHQTIAALEAVKASGRTWSEQAVADEAGLSVADLRAVVGRVESPA